MIRSSKDTGVNSRLGGIKVSYPLIDCDVHEDVRSTEAVIAYMSDSWREFASLQGTALVDGISSSGLNPYGYHRKDSLPPEGGPPGSSPSFMAEQLLDPLGIDHAVLTGDAMSNVLGALANPHLARELARALNRYRAECWLEEDPRF